MAKKAAKQPRSLELVLIAPKMTVEPAEIDRAGGEKHSGRIARFFGASKITKSADEIQEDLSKLSDVLSTISQALADKIGKNMQFKELEVALAISAEGSIGIATAGVEASLTLTFERRGS